MISDVGRAGAVGTRVPGDAGQIIRFSTVDGPQVVDLNLWARDDPRERFWAARTRQFYGTHVTTGHRLWSNLPFLRPMVTFIADTVGYGRDEDDAGCHDLLGTRCDPYVNQLLSGAAYDFHCHSNLTRAVAQFGLTEFDVHDVINLFQVTGSDARRQALLHEDVPGAPRRPSWSCSRRSICWWRSRCALAAISPSRCGAKAPMREPNCNPLRVEVFEPDSALLDGWKPVAAGSVSRRDRPSSRVRRTCRSAAAAHRACPGHGLGPDGDGGSPWRCRGHPAGRQRLHGQPCVAHDQFGVGQPHQPRRLRPDRAAAAVRQAGRVDAQAT